MDLNKSTSIFIVGGSGTFGLSTAWYLAREGYTNIRSLDRWPVPLLSSAGYDRNKTGWIFGTDGFTELGRSRNFDKCCENTRRYGDSSKIEDFSDWNAAVAKFPVLDSGPDHSEGKEGFRGIFNANAGWVSPLEAMTVISKECMRLGVKFASGINGTAVELLRTADGKKINGIRTEDGKKWFADKIILATGSYSDTLLDFCGQLQAVAYVVSYVRLSEEQYQRYKDIPVLNISRRGYSTDCSYLNTGYPNGNWGPVSIPRDQAYHPADTQPLEAHNITQKFLRYLLPELAHAEVESFRMCWDMETHDYNWLIDYHPNYSASLLIATGGSGHSFKNIVNVGKYIVQSLEGTLNEEHKELWRWRPDRIGKDLESEERARRPKVELAEVTGWNHD